MTARARLELQGPMHAGFDEILTPDALELVGELQHRFGSRRQRAARGARASARATAGGRAARLPGRDARDPRGRLDGRAGPARPAGPPGGDHRPDRPQDDHQRAELGRRRCSWPTSRTPTRRPGATWSRARSTCATRSTARSPTTTPTASTTSSPRRRPRCWCGRAAGICLSGTCWSTAEPVAGSLFDFGLYFFHNARQLLARGSGPVLLSAQDGVPPRGQAVERRVRLRPGVPGDPARHDQGHGADRDAARSVRDGRDPVRAARALRRPELPAAGTTSSRRSSASRTRARWSSPTAAR